jgi:hypothetical protein
MTMPLRINGFSFDEAFDLAVHAVAGPWGEGGTARPLADYVAAVPLTANQWQLLADLLRMLPEHLPRGAHGKRRKPTNNEAAKQIARQAIPQLKRWRKQHRLQRIPLAVKKQIILGTADNAATHLNEVLLLLKNQARL